MGLISTAHSTAAQWLLALYSSLSPAICRDLKGELWSLRLSPLRQIWGVELVLGKDVM